METVETVFVTDDNHPDGYNINVEDFNEAVHKKADPVAAAKPKGKKAAPAPDADPVAAE